MQVVNQPCQSLHLEGLTQGGCEGCWWPPVSGTHVQQGPGVMDCSAPEAELLSLSACALNLMSMLPPASRMQSLLGNLGGSMKGGFISLGSWQRTSTQ